MTARTAFVLFGGLLLAAFDALPARAAGPWTWSVEPAFGRPKLDIATHVEEGGAPFGNRVDASLSRSESMPSLRLEGTGGRFGFLLEGERWSVREEERVPVLGGSLTAVADFEETRFLAAATLQPHPAWTFFLGARATEAREGLSADFSLAILPDVRYRFSQTLVDGVLGARFEQALWQGLRLRMQADAGAGASKRSWNAAADLGWSLGAAERCTIFIGYRYGEQRFTDTSNGARIDVRFEQQGGNLGVRFRW